MRTFLSLLLRGYAAARLALINLFSFWLFRCWLSSVGYWSLVPCWVWRGGVGWFFLALSARSRCGLYAEVFPSLRVGWRNKAGWRKPARRSPKLSRGSKRKLDTPLLNPCMWLHRCTVRGSFLKYGFHRTASAR